MTVRAEVASVELPIEEVLALRPGDVLRLDAPRRRRRDALRRQGARPPRPKPGRSGSRRAVQVTEPPGRGAHERPTTR